MVFWSIYYMMCCLFLASFMFCSRLLGFIGQVGMGLEGEGEAGGLGYLASPSP